MRVDDGCKFGLVLILQLIPFVHSISDKFIESFVDCLLLHVLAFGGYFWDLAVILLLSLAG